MEHLVILFPGRNRLAMERCWDLACKGLHCLNGRCLMLQRPPGLPGRLCFGRGEHRAGSGRFRSKPRADQQVPCLWRADLKHSKGLTKRVVFVTFHYPSSSLVLWAVPYALFDKKGESDLLQDNGECRISLKAIGIENAWQRAGTIKRLMEIVITFVERVKIGNAVLFGYDKWVLCLARRMKEGWIDF